MIKNIFKSSMARLLIVAALSIANFANAGTLKNVYAQSDFVNEKINISLAKQVYFAGEKMIFGVATYDASSACNLSMSSVVYVELISQAGSVMQQQKAYLNNGKATVSIALSKNLATDYYYLRAYTNYMQNLGEESFAMARIELINPFKNFFPANNSNSDFNPIEIYFEGGKAFSSIENKFAIACKKSDAKPFVGNVNLFSDSHSLIASVVTDSLGFAVGSFTAPNQGKYSIEINDAGNVVSFEFEVFDNQQVASILVNTEDEFFHIKTICTIEDASLVVYQNNLPLYEKNLAINNDEVRIQKSDLPRGVLRLAIMQSSQVIAQTFLENPYEIQNVEISDLPKSINRRSNSQWSLSAQGMLSYSIVDAQSLRPQLSNPDFIYFNRYFKYSDLLKSEQSSAFRKFILLKSAVNDTLKSIENNLLPEFKGDVLSGQIVDANTNSPVSDLTIYAVVPDSVSFFSTTKTSTEGNYSIVIDSVNPASEVILVIADTNAQYLINPNSEFSIIHSNIVAENYLPDSKLYDFVQQQMINIQVQDAFCKNTTEQLSTNILFYGHESQIVYFDKYIKLPIMQEYIKELMPGVYVQKRHKHKYIRISNFAGRGYIGKNPLVLVNGIPIANHEAVLALDPKKVDYVRLFNYRLYFKNMTFDGIFDLKTKDDIDLKSLISKNCFVEDYRAPQKSVEQSVTVATDLPKRTPDFRMLLQYGFNLDAKDAHFDFLTSDISGNYVLRVNGFDDSKNIIIRAEKSFEVKK